MAIVIKSHKDLEVWKQSMKLVQKIYAITQTLPSEEKFGIIQQMRRAVVSIPANIAEGAGRLYPKEFKQFLNIASGSLSELETLYLICFDANMLNPDPDLLNNFRHIRSMLSGLINSIKVKNNDPLTP